MFNVHCLDILGNLYVGCRNLSVTVGQHKWKALRSLKKARIEAGTYIQDRLKVEEKAKVDLFKVASKKTEKVGC